MISKGPGPPPPLPQTPYPTPHTPTPTTHTHHTYHYDHHPHKLISGVRHVKRQRVSGVQENRSTVTRTAPMGAELDTDDTATAAEAALIAATIGSCSSSTLMTLRDTCSTQPSTRILYTQISKRQNTIRIRSENRAAFPSVPFAADDNACGLRQPKRHIECIFFCNTTSVTLSTSPKQG